MKKLLICLVLLPFMSFGQNRFTELFQDADSAFSTIAENVLKETALKLEVKSQIKPYTDERTQYKKICEVLDSDTASYQCSVRESMYSYFSGYLDGLNNSGEIKNVDFEKFLNDIVNEKRALKRWIRIKKILSHDQNQRKN